MSRLDILRKWILKAKYDLDWARDSLDDKRYSGVCFLSQQVIEKCLKVCIILDGKSLVKIHDLVELLGLLGDRYSILKKYKRDLAKISGFYIASRYPDTDDKEFTKDDAVHALKIAQGIYDFVEKEFKR